MPFYKIIVFFFAFFSSLFGMYQPSSEPSEQASNHAESSKNKPLPGWLRLKHEKLVLNLGLTDSEEEEEIVTSEKKHAHSNKSLRKTKKKAEQPRQIQKYFSTNSTYKNRTKKIGRLDPIDNSSTLSSGYMITEENIQEKKDILMQRMDYRSDRSSKKNEQSFKK